MDSEAEAVAAADGENPTALGTQVGMVGRLLELAYEFECILGEALKEALPPTVLRLAAYGVVEDEWERAKILAMLISQAMDSGMIEAALKAAADPYGDNDHVAEMFSTEAGNAVLARVLVFATASAISHHAIFSSLPPINGWKHAASAFPVAVSKVNLIRHAVQKHSCEALFEYEPDKYVVGGPN